MHQKHGTKRGALSTGSLVGKKMGEHSTRDMDSGWYRGQELAIEDLHSLVLLSPCFGSLENRITHHNDWKPSLRSCGTGNTETLEVNGSVCTFRHNSRYMGHQDRHFLLNV